MITDHEGIFRRHSQQKFGNHPTQIVNELRKKIQNYSFSMNDRIGKGYSSIVYKGSNDITKQIVAIKVIDLKSIKDQILKNLLDTEIKCIQLLSHQNLLKFHQSFMTVNNCYIVTEFCQGGDLSQELKKRKRFTEKEVMDIFQQLYKGYEKLLSVGYIHRDIKPANIFIKNGQLKIADFGFVKPKTETQKELYNVGTALYMSPEAMYHNLYSEKSDIWAIGIMIYQLIHGKTPWKGLIERQIKIEIESAIIQFDDSLMSTQLKNFLQKCLKRNINERISIAEMIYHPWMIKIQQKNIKIYNQPSQKNGKQINKLNHYCGELRPNNKSERSTMESKKQFSQENKQNIAKNIMNFKNMPSLTINRVASYENQKQITKKDKNSLQFLISVLNYLRYLYRLYKILNQIEFTQILNLKNTISNQLIKGIQLHERMILSKQNTFKLSAWQRFTDSSKWSMYADVVRQYSERYKKLKTVEKANTINLPLNILIKQAINKLLKLQFSSKEKEEKYKNLSLADNLLTLLQLNILISENGWQEFVQKSQINHIVKFESLINEYNYLSMLDQINKKIKILF